MFFKLVNNELISATRVITPNGELTESNLTDGWVSADTSDEALLLLSNTPITLTKRQVALVLCNMGQWENFKSILATQPEIVQIEWETTSNIARDNALVNQMATHLNLSESEIDNLFMEGSKL